MSPGGIAARILGEHLLFRYLDPEGARNWTALFPIITCVHADVIAVPHSYPFSGASRK